MPLNAIKQDLRPASCHLFLCLEFPLSAEVLSAFPRLNPHLTQNGFLLPLLCSLQGLSSASVSNAREPSLALPLLHHFYCITRDPVRDQDPLGHVDCRSVLPTRHFSLILLKTPLELRCMSVAEHSPSTQETLGSISRTTK
jgi:hypothetical protein